MCWPVDVSLNVRIVRQNIQDCAGQLRLQIKKLKYVSAQYSSSYYENNKSPFGSWNNFKTDSSFTIIAKLLFICKKIIFLKWRGYGRISKVRTYYPINQISNIFLKIDLKFGKLKIDAPRKTNQAPLPARCFGGDLK